MNTAKLFSNGGSQAVRLPMNCSFPGKEVGIVKTDDCVILFPLEKSDEIFLRGACGFHR